MYTCIHLPRLPKIPSELLDYQIDTDAYVTSLPGRTVTKDNQVYSPGVYAGQLVSTALESWIQRHIIAEWREHIVYSKISPPCLGPHLDRTRFYTLQYIIDTGGSEVATVFYRARSENLQMDTGKGLYFNDYSQLEPFDTVYARPGEWYLINGRQIHSVENIQSTRVAVQIGLMRDPIEEFLLINPKEKNHE
jgi:hypothetical protein